MKKRMFLGALLLLALLSVGARAANDAAYRRQYLPECYTHLTYGAANVFCDEFCPVYERESADSRMITALFTGDPVQIDGINEKTGWVKIWYFKNAESGAAQGDYPNCYDDGRSVYGYAPMDCIVPEYAWNGAMTVLSAKPGDRVNLRSKADKGSASLGKYYSGTIVRRLEPGSHNGYIKVSIGHVVGYMDERYLQPGPTVERTELRTVTAAGATGVNIRKQPGSNSEIIKTIPNGARATVLSVRADDWIQVIYEEECGYARRSLFKGADAAELKW